MFQNFYVTKLSQNITDTDLTMDVDIPPRAGITSGNLVISMKNPAQREIIRFTNVTGNTLTILRGRQFTTAISHSLGEEVVMTITEDDLSALTVQPGAVGTTELQDDAVIPAKIPDRLRRVPLEVWSTVDGTYAKVASDYAGSTLFSPNVTPFDYVRARGVVPTDYASGDVTIVFYLGVRGSDLTNLSHRRFAHSHNVGDPGFDVTPGTDTWNVIHDETFNYSYVDSVVQRLEIVIPAADVGEGYHVGCAVRPDVLHAVPIYVWSATLEYMADS